MPGPQRRDEGAAERLLEAVRPDLAGARDRDRRAAIGMVWTADHLDVARRFQSVVTGPARAAVARGPARGRFRGRSVRGHR